MKLNKTGGASLLTAVMALLIAFSVSMMPSLASASGGSGSGGGGGGGGSTATPVICFSNLDANDQTTGIAGWGLLGLLDLTGEFDCQGEQFSAGASGKIARLRIPIYRTNTGGNSTVNMYLYTDSITNPGTPDVLLQVIPVTPWPSFNNTPVNVNVSNGATLVAGQTYWLIAEPRSQLRAAWALNDINEVGLHIDIWSVFGTTYWTSFPQGAFEIDVLP
jgi:hypothetical protein